MNDISFSEEKYHKLFFNNLKNSGLILIGLIVSTVIKIRYAMLFFGVLIIIQAIRNFCVYANKEKIINKYKLQD